MKKIFLLLLSAAAMSIGCSKGSNSSGNITIDGEKIDLPYTYCIKQNNAYRLILLNHNKVTEQEIKNIFREAPENELSITILADSDPMTSSIIADNYRQLGIKMKVDSEPKNTGDILTITIPEVVKFKPAMGKFTDKEITVSGTFSAKYVGESE
ncbi:MAG: hypothetical protein KA015_00465 [Spirochaetes bacterium]|nr:hypothetical protein [Spirochaetota bacterium]